MRYKSLSLSLSLSLVLLGLCSTNLKAQLYSSGNNSIAGNKVGIGVNAPTASLHLKDYSGITQAGMTNVPLLRFQSLNSDFTPTTFYWDFRMDLSSKLTFWHHSSQNVTATQSFQLGSDYVKVFERLKIGEDGEFCEALTPSNTQGYALSMGLKKISSGAWQGQGLIMFGDEFGELRVVRNKTTNIISGSNSMVKNSLFQVGSSGMSLFLDQGTTQTDLSFYDTWNLTGEQRTFVIRAHTAFGPVGKTLEFLNPQNNGSAYFAMPVRIGGAANDVTIINSNYDLYVEGGIRATTVKVDAYSNWPDYVFETNYDLMSLKLTEKYILANKHLPGVPSAKEIKEDGIELAEMNAILLQKIEELTLHLIELQKQVNGLVK